MHIHVLSISQFKIVTMFNITSSRCLLFFQKRHDSCIIKAFRYKSTSKFHSSLPRQTHYEVLGLQKAASSVDIKEAFVKLSKQIHPDINPSDPDNHTKFVRLNEAYSVLSKRQSRREYDMSQGAGWINSYNTSNSGRSRQEQEAWYADGVSREDGPFAGSSGTAYPSDSYYGIKGVRRLPNYVIAAGCAVVVAFGFVYFFLAYKYTVNRQKYRLDTVDKRYLMHLKETQKNARVNGLERQLELLNTRSRTPKFDSRRLDESNSPPPTPPSFTNIIHPTPSPP